MVPPVAEPLDTYLSVRLDELKRGSTSSAWDFLCLAAILEYIASLDRRTHFVRGRQKPERGHDYFVRFVKNYMPNSYQSFTYQSGVNDLPSQMYYILRCGLLHSFSLSQDALRGGGRTGSIVLTHDEAHLSTYAGQSRNPDNAILRFDQLLEDIRTGLFGLIAASQTDPDLKARIRKRIADAPPLTQLP
jgi:hypothetical protein